VTGRHLRAHFHFQNFPEHEIKIPVPKNALMMRAVAVSALLMTLASALAASSSPRDSAGNLHARELAPHRLPALAPHRLPALAPPALRLARAAGPSRGPAGPSQDCVAAALCLRGGSGSGRSSVQLTTVPFEVRLPTPRPREAPVQRR